MTPQKFIFPNNNVFIGGGSCTEFKFSAPEDAASWDTTITFKRRDVIVCAAEDVEELQRVYGWDYEVIAA